MPALARALKVVKKSESLGYPVGGAGAGAGAGPRPGTDDAATLGATLLELVEAAHLAGLDPEDALRVATDRRIDQMRRHEADEQR
jgi:hypothetical protein